MPARLLVVYYTRTGATRRLAGSIAAELGADVDEIVDVADRSGVLGYLRSGFQATFRRPAPIGPAVRDPASYDLVIIGTPIWNMSVSSPVRSYLDRHRGRFRKVGFFCTCGGSGADRVFAQMAEVGEAKPVATLVVRDADLESSAPAVERFAAEIVRALGATPPPPISPSPRIPPGPAATKP
ncbi:MAG: flavodoxin [Deltaproteobacteria bacterium]|nr:flavodoxin [Deltaproteobacteria bacterium]